MPEFLTVKEAAQLTGKSSSSIRRIIYPILRDEKHSDRKHIQPSPKEALQLRMKGENFAWRVSEEFLRREVPIESQSEKGSAASSPRSSHEGGELLSMLRRELEIKNQQIAQQSEMLATQMKLISGLSERLREGNILIGSLQRQLALPEANEKPVAEASAVVPAATPPAVKEKGTKPTPKPPKPKKSLLRRLFG